MDNLSLIGRKLLENRYLKRDSNGEISENPPQLFKRVAKELADFEKSQGEDENSAYEEFLNVMKSLDFLPNTPALINLGTSEGQLASCFVLPLDDSVDSIFNTALQSAIIQKNGGGVGYSLSSIRPENDKVSSLGNVASGPVPYLLVLNSISETIKQSGRRYAANIGVLRIDHPDIEKFIMSKSLSGTLSKFNLSVGITDEFIHAVKEEKEFALINPRTKCVVRTILASELFNLLAEMSWKTGDPGVIFLDRINQENPNPHLGMIEATNPCGELPLFPYESCVIGAVNLSNMVNHGNGSINWEKFKQTIYTGVKILDNLISMNDYVLPQIKESTVATRKIGLGLMGWADTLIKLNIPYESELAIDAAEEIMEYFCFHSKLSSIMLAKERGKYPAYEGCSYSISPSNIIPKRCEEVHVFSDRPPLDWNSISKNLEDFGIRNATVNTIAPTGSLSILANVSPGIEPLFSLSSIRISEGIESYEFKEIFEEKMEELDLFDEELKRVAGKTGSISSCEIIPSEIKSIFKIAKEIHYKTHLKMQAAFQKYIDNSISKTINLSRNATKNDIKEIFLLANELGCKGVTVYRDGSRIFQPFNSGLNKQLNLEPRKIPTGNIPTKSISIEVPPNNKTMTIFIREVENQPFDFFVILGRAGSDVTAYTEAIGRLISLALRCNIPVNLIAENLEGLGGRYSMGFGKDKILSVPDAIGKKLREEYVKTETRSFPAEICPECNNISLEYSGGCFICRVCGFEWCY